MSTASNADVCGLLASRRTSAPFAHGSKFGVLYIYLIYRMFLAVQGVSSELVSGLSD